jgi:hypothetical protein
VAGAQMNQVLSFPNIVAAFSLPSPTARRRSKGSRIFVWEYFGFEVAVELLPRVREKGTKGAHSWPFLFTLYCLPAQ